MEQERNSQALIFGKNGICNIVSAEVKDDVIELFIEKDGEIRSEFKPNRFWILSNKQLDRNFFPLEGSLHYKYMKLYKDRKSYYMDKRRYKECDIYSVADEKESAMMNYGFTYFKNMKVNDVSILSFDIETTGLVHDNTSKVLLISNTYRSQGRTIRKLFAYDEYDTEAGLFDAWSEWVRTINPSVLCGHNIFMYDLPYMEFCARKADTSLALGRDGSDLRINNYDSKFRKDGDQFYEYKRSFVYGREIVDTMFVAYKYDFARKYENYRLKQIIKQEGLEIKDRQFYDADTIRDNYKIGAEWEKIKKYAEHDADDALALYDLMIPAYFYLTPSIPKSFQSMMYSASGSQINAFLVRSYLQNGKSVPKTTEAQAFEGAISMGNPGIYKNVFKVDVASLYPSIMLQYQVYDKHKDPEQNFYKMVDYFTNERLANKKLAKETGDRYYKDLEQAQKIIINSAYGMMGTPGLNFNSPFNAAMVTRKGREILQASIDWSAENGFQLVNADTDSISITYNGQFLDKDERKQIVDCINSIYPDRIRFEDDGYYPSVVITKAKNYALKDETGKVKIKGSGLKGTMKEKALQQFMKDVLNVLLDGTTDQLLPLYHTYVKEIYNLKDISRWTSKKTITESVLNPERTNEQKVLDAIDGQELQEGDKIYVYFDKEGALKLQEKWNNDHDAEKLVKKLYSTIEIFDAVVNMEAFPKYHLKSHAVKCALADVLGIPHPEKVKRVRKKKEEASISNSSLSA